MLTLSPFLMLIACGDKETDSAAVGEWWEVDENSDAEADEDKSDEDKSDEDKSDEEYEQGDSWNGEGSQTSGPEQITYTYVTEDAACTLSFALSDVVADETCSDCQFAWQFTYGEATITEDGAGCEALEELTGTSGGYGHGTSGKGEYAGFDYYDLQHFDPASGTWSEYADGYSGVDGGGVWIFGQK